MLHTYVATGRGRQPDPALTLVRLDVPPELQSPEEYVVGIAQLGARIVLVSLRAQHLSTEQRRAGQHPDAYVIQRSYAPDLSSMRCEVLTLVDPRHLSVTRARLAYDAGQLVLNTFAERTPFDIDANDILAARVAITERAPVKIGDAPLPPLIQFPNTITYAYAQGTLKMASDFVMVGTDTAGVERWRLKLGAHLYTRVEFREDVAYFGTAGSGGYFHCLNPVTGAERYRIQTGGTDGYTWWGDDKIILHYQRGIGGTAAALVIDARSGAELVRLSLGRFNLLRSDTPQFLANGAYYTTAFAPDHTQWLMRVDLSQVRAA